MLIRVISTANMKAPNKQILQLENQAFEKAHWVYELQDTDRIAFKGDW